MLGESYENKIRGIIQSCEDATVNYRSGSPTRKWEVVILDERTKSSINRGFANKVKLVVYDKCLVDSLQPGHQVEVIFNVEGNEYINKRNGYRKDIFTEVIALEVKQLETNK